MKAPHDALLMAVMMLLCVIAFLTAAAGAVMTRNFLVAIFSALFAGKCLACGVLFFRQFRASL